MKFIIAIEPGTDSTAWSVVVPDLPGCFSAGDTLDEAMDKAREAIELHVQTLVEDGQAIPVPGRTLAQWRDELEFAGWVWAVVDAPVEKYFGPAEKINITVPRAILSRIDDYARKHGMSRSGFLVEAARTAMQT